jgi:hypothetical protein
METFQTVGAFAGILVVFLIGPILYLDRAVHTIMEYLDRKEAEDFEGLP